MTATWLSKEDQDQGPRALRMGKAADNGFRQPVQVMDGNYNRQHRRALVRGGTV